MSLDTVAAWDLAEAERLLESPAVGLLRGRNAAFTLTFLHRAFKEHHAISVPESQLRARLENFLDETRERRPGVFPQTGAEYLAAWCGPEQLLLKKFYSHHADEPVFELTAAAERAMQWLEDLEERAFVGTESRLELILRQLEEIVLFATPDVVTRVAALRSQQAAIQEQIDGIESSQVAATFSPIQLTERFANALDMARSLASDFRHLEEKFKEVARELAAAQTKPGATKGRMVGQLLDTHAALKDSPQGQSFYAFWALLSSPERQQRWRELTRAVYRLNGIDETLRANRLLERLSGRLLVEGERVVRSNERMAATLRRALEHAATGEDTRLRELVREIQRLALSCTASPPRQDEFFELDLPDYVYGSFSRTFWQPEASGRLAGELTALEAVLDPELVERFRALAELSLPRLREQVRACLVSTDSVLLSEVLRRFPPKEGVVEVIGYLVIALHDQGHYVAMDQLAHIPITESGDGSELWRVPEVLFARHGTA